MNNTAPQSPKLEAFAPEGLADYLDTLPFLGALSCSHSEAVAGSTEELIFDYVVGSAALADGGWFKITFKFYSDWALLQTSRPNAPDYLSAEYIPREPFPGESEASVQQLLVRFDQKGHERPYQKAIIVDVVDGYLKPGDIVRIRLGDRRFGGSGTRIQTFHEDAFRFRGYVDTAGTSRFAAIPGDIVLRIKPGKPEHLTIITPRLVKPGTSFPIRIRAEDCWGNVCAPFTGALNLELSGRHLSPQTTTLKWPNTGDTSVVSHTLILPTEGQYELRVSSDTLPALTKSVPVTASETLDQPRAWFADLHVHSHDTVGTNSTLSNYLYARDVAGLDVLGYTVNDFQIRPDRWNEAVQLARELHKEDAFIVFPGTEWCGSSAAGGDHNVIFIGDEIRFPTDSSGQSLRSFEWHEDLTGSSNQTPGRWPLTRVYDAYADRPQDFLMIPHVGGRRALLEWHHPELERLIEITSSWGHFHWFYQDAIARGWKLGASAAGDEHRGRPGGGAPGVSMFGVRGGLTGILAPDLKRNSIASAMRSRHTWATTGDRIVAILRSGSHIQGDEFSQTGAAQISYQLYGDTGWEHVSLHDHDGILWERNLHKELGYSSTRIRFRWGGARIKDRYRWAIWRGSVKVSNSLARLVSISGLEHSEEKVWESPENEFRFFTETYGDVDQFELELEDLVNAQFEIKVEIDGFHKTGDPTRRNPWKGTPATAFFFNARDLLQKGEIRWELDGVELFFAAERLTEAALPRDLTGEWLVPAQNAHFGFRPIYLHARERNDTKVWTSPLFIHFE